MLPAVESDISRHLFIQSLKGLVENSDPDDPGIGLLLIDIKGFRKINSVFGIDQGDKILKETLDRLKNAFSKNDHIYRLGNDEFAILLPGLLNPNLVNLAANKVSKVLGDHYTFGQSNLKLGLNIGSAYSVGKYTINDLLSNAERSLASAKASGKTYVVRDFVEQSNDERNLNLETELHEALTKNTMELYYQPKVDLHSGNPTHAEALVRWTSPSSGPISPMIFVPIIEQIGRMEDLTKWAVNTAIRQAKDWPTTWGELSVAVNVCPSLVDDPELLNFVSNAITIWDIDPGRLTLEITEGSIIQDQQGSFANLTNIKKRGVKISIDDFGTGYSSLAYFKNIPADELKIDKSFVFSMLENEGDMHITHVITDLAHKFKLSVVAEGVETKEVLYALVDAHCDYAQGFYFSKPLPQGEFIDWLNNYNAGNYF